MNDYSKLDKHMTIQSFVLKKFDDVYDCSKLEIHNMTI